MLIDKIARFSRFVLFSAFFLFVFALFSGEISSPDFWWHLKIGEYIYTVKSLPDADPFSFTTPSENSDSGGLVRFILTQYWLAQTLFYRIYAVSGFQGIIFLRATILTLLFLFIYRSIRREECSMYCSLAILLPALVLFYFGYTAERPQLFSFLFSFLLIYLIEGFRRKETCGKDETIGDSLRLVETRGDDETYRDLSRFVENNSPLKKGDKGGCYSPDNENRSKQPPAPPLLRGNKAEDSAGTYTETSSQPVIARSEATWQSLLWSFLPSLRGAERRGNLSLASLKTRLLHFVRNDILKAMDKGYGEPLPKNHPHPNPPPSMGREMPSQTVSTSLNQPQSVSMSLHKSPQVSSLMYLLPIPIIMLLWANLHGGFIIGIVIITGYIISETAKYLYKKPGQALPFRPLKLFFITGVLSIVLSFLNPNGYKAFTIMLLREQGDYNLMITETVSPFRQLGLGFYSPELMIYFLLLFLVFVLFLINLKKLDLSDLIIFSILAGISLYYARANPFFAPFAALMVARYGMKAANLFSFSSRFRLDKRRQPISAKLSYLHIAISLCLAGLLLYAVFKGDIFNGLIRTALFNRTHDVTANKYPEGAAAFIKNARLSGNMFNPYDWGGYLLWAVHPDHRVFIDGRGLNEDAALDGAKIMEAYDSGQGIPDWKELLDKYGIKFMVVYSVNSFSGRLLPLIPAMLNDQEWHLIYLDSISLIFLRDTSENRPVINKFGMPKEWLWSTVVSEARLKSGGFWSKGVLSNFYATAGDAFFARKYYREANLEYMKALSVDPENSAARKRLELLRSYGF